MVANSETSGNVPNGSLDTAATNSKSCSSKHLCMVNRYSLYTSMQNIPGIDGEPVLSWCRGVLYCPNIHSLRNFLVDKKRASTAKWSLVRGSQRFYDVHAFDLLGLGAHSRKFWCFNLEVHVLLCRKCQHIMEFGCSLGTTR